MKNIQEKVKEHLVEMNQAKKLIAYLPSKKWQEKNKKLLKQKVKSIENFKKKDIVIEDIQENKEQEVVIVTVCICGFLRFALVIDKEFNVHYHQLKWKGIPDNYYNVN